MNLKIKNISLMILSAGYGKRLRPLTDTVPKPLIKIKNTTLLGNIINNTSFTEMIINIHYKSEIIKNYIRDKFPEKNIILSYEKKLLDTAGGVKNASKHISNDFALVLNSDVFWSKMNFKEILNSIQSLHKDTKCKLFLIESKNAYGIDKVNGDFSIKNGKLERYNYNFPKLYYSGAQIISLNFLKTYKKNIVSFNLIWDDLIKKNMLEGEIIKSKWYHVGDYKGLNIVKDLD